MKGVLRLRWWWFQLALTAGFVGLILWRVDVGQVGEPLSQGNYAWAALAFLIFTLVRVLQTIRWRLYLAKVGRLPLSSLFGAVLIGNLGNNLLPMRAGDVARIQILANRFGVSRAGLAATVFAVEGILEGVVFLVLLLLALAFLDVGFVPPAILWSLAVTVGGGFLLLVLVSRFFPPDLAERRWLRWLPGKVRALLASIWPSFLVGLETMRNARLLAATLGLNFVDKLAQALAFLAFGLAFGLDLAFSAYMVIMIAANLVIAVPITFQNIGTYQVALMGVMMPLGVKEDEALAYAVATHMLINFWVIATGVVAVWLMRISPREVFGVQRAGQAAAAPLPKEVSPPIG